MKFKIVAAILLVILVIAGLAGIKALQIKGMIDAGASMEAMPTSVEVRSAAVDEWEQKIDSIGTIKPIRGITIQSEAEGVVRDIQFEPGGHVDAGEVLVVLDQEVQSAEMEVAKAALDLAEKNLKRTRELHSKQNISEDALDKAEAEFKMARATVANLKAVLDKRTIRAPFPGMLGVRELSPGEYITKGRPIVSLQASDRVYVDMSVPQNSLSKLSTGLEVRLTTDAWPGEVFTGELTAIDPQVDPATRSVNVQATFENPDGQLLPGLFVNVSIIQPQKRRVVIVPKSAVVHANYGDSVYAVRAGEDGGETVEQKIVRLGESKGDFVELTQGLDGTEEVVTAGAFKLRDGALIQRSSLGTVDPQLDPSPADG